ncbi:MAG: LacI family DNA-binding transcriptional regulator [Cellulophaga sp.]
MNKKKHTIKDIAKLAKVSKGTVDRVLHKRGKVSKEAFKRVSEVLEEIEYQPNLIARNLKNNKTYRLCVLIPDCNEDPYWAPAYDGVREAAFGFQSFGVHVEEFRYQPLDKSLFVQKSLEIIQSSPDGFLLVPLFLEESQEIIKNCKKKGILVLVINNFIDSLKEPHFIGQDLYQSGRVAANLIDFITPKNACIAIVHINLDLPMRLKETGFKKYYEEKKESHHEIITFNVRMDDMNYKSRILFFIQENPKISAILITNSKAYILAEALQAINKEIIVVGYDLLDENIKYLKGGNIDFLIHQKLKQQAALGVSFLAEYFLFEKSIPKQKLLPIDIVTSENVTYYLE